MAALIEHLIDHHLSDCPDCPAADESILSIWHISMLFPPNAQIREAVQIREIYQTLRAPMPSRGHTLRSETPTWP